MISVAMATYNGGKYIRRQLESILPQLGVDDEIVISDDGSSDDTLSRIAELNDSRIRVLNGPKNGVTENFEHACRNCRGEVIFLCDQDDEWLPNKVESVMRAFESTDCPVVMHDAEVVDEFGNVIYPSLFKLRGVRHGIAKNIIKNTYVGSCMAFRRSLLDHALPFRGSKRGNLHDTWLGLISEFKGGFYFLDEILQKYYRYTTSVTSQELRRGSVMSMIVKRIITVWNVLLWRITK